MKYLVINEEKVEIDKVTYSDLLMIGKQYYDEYKKFPVQKDFNATNNDLPNDCLVNKMLKSYGKTKLDYYLDLGCDDYSLLSCYMTEEQRNKMFFPLHLPSGIIIYYDYSDDPNSNKINWLHCHDQYGYKYYTTRQRMQHCQHNNNIPDRFRFDKPIYLEYNINNLLRLNNCIYKVHEIPNGCKGHDNISLISIYGDITYATVNQIAKYISRYTEEGRQLALKRDLSLQCSKEDAIRILKEKMQLLNRPLAIKDLKGKSYDNNYISRKTIEKYWGTFSNMMHELSENGCQLSSTGFGIHYILQNGDFVKSNYEYDFSQALISAGFIYGETYFRDIRYSKIIDSYTGRMNCDYMLILNGNVMYIELAGMLNDKKHIDAFLNNQEIDNPIFEKYRKKLTLKKQILDECHVDYKILLEPDLNISNYNHIINEFIKNSNQ